MRWDHSSTAPNLQSWNTSSCRLCHSRSSWGLPEQPLLSPAAQSAAVMVFEFYFFYAGCNEWNRSLLYFWVVFYPQTKYSFKYYFQTSDEQLRCKLHLTRHAKPFFPLHENNCELIWIFFKIIIQKWHNWHQSDPEPGSQGLVYATRTCLLCCYFVNVFLSTSSNFTFLKAERPIYARKKQQQRCVSNS